MDKYAFFDGDDIGGITERFLHNGNIKEAQIFSESLKIFFYELDKTLKNLNELEILILGGDDLLIKYNSKKYSNDFFEEIRLNFFKSTNTTLSCGIGKTVQEAIFSLYLAKLYGKNQIIEHVK